MGGWRGSPLRAPQPPPAPAAPQLRCQMKRQLYPPRLLAPPWEAMQIPGILGHSPNMPPREAGESRGEHGAPQPPDPTLGCRGHSPPSSPPFPHPGKPGPRGQTVRSRSGSKNSPAPCPVPPFQDLLWPSAPAKRQPEWLPSLLGPCQAGGRDTGGVTRGWPEGASPSAIPDIGFCHGTAAFWGAPRPVRCQVYFVPAAVH